MKYFSLLLLLIANFAFAEDTFKAKVTLDLCPDYKTGQTSFELKYRLENSQEFKDPTILNQTLDIPNNRAIVTLLFPANFGATKFLIWSYCRNSHGSSDPSNEVSVSFCDSQANRDSDNDGLKDNEEDKNCNNQFDTGDYSNLFVIDSDGDGVRDLAEKNADTDPLNPASSAKPIIFASAPFDPDRDGNANPVIWRKGNSTWFIKNSSSTTSIVFGLSTDIPFVYQPKNAPSNVGTISIEEGNGFSWKFNGPGFRKANGSFENQINIGAVGDIITLGPWEETGVTNPAVARLEGNSWNFSYYGKNGIVSKNLGIKGDIPKAQDYDGDGKFDVAVFRPSTLQVLVLQSSNNTLQTYTAGSSTAESFVVGDYTGDAKGEISFWEASSSTFNYKFSASSYSTGTTLQVGTAGSSFPLNWNFQGGKNLFTVVDHSTGVRTYYLNNNPATPAPSLQWGIAGDHQG